MAFKIGLLGLGTVGTGTAQILLDPSGRNPLLEELEIYRIGVRNREKTRPVPLSPGILTDDLESIVTDPNVDIVVEVIGGLEPARSLILKAISHGKHVVTANKAVIARYSDEIFDAANEAGVYVLLEAAVGGGIPVIQPLKQALGVNRIHSVIGIVNGTTNYILTRMQTEKANFADVLAQAQELGYAEADPTADVEGFDAADKIAILAALAFGGRIKLEDVYREGISQVSAADIAYADKLGFVIKLLAIANREMLQDDPTDRLRVRVHPTLVPLSHPLASINGVYNAILVAGDPIGQVMFFGPGAGAGPTASAVVSDILNIAAVLKSVGEGDAGTRGRGDAGEEDMGTRGRGDAGTFSTTLSASPRPPLSASSSSLHPLLTCTHQHYCKIAPIEELTTRFYARFLTKDRPGVIGKLGTSFGNHGVSIESIVQTGFQGELAEIVVVTHDVREGDFHQALDEIRTLESVDSIPSLLRVL